MELLT